MFWIFKKKEDKKAHQKIDHIHKILKNSFKNVKEDIEELGNWQKSLEHSHKEYKYKIEEFNLRLVKIESLLFSLNKTQKIEEKQIKTTKKEENTQRHSDLILDLLTSTQLDIFTKIYYLQKQIGTKISYKSLSKILYGEKSYNEVRSTISEYITFLEEHGLIKKFRKGRESYVGVTERGSELLKILNKKEPVENDRNLIF